MYQFANNEIKFSSKHDVFGMVLPHFSRNNGKIAFEETNVQLSKVWARLIDQRSEVCECVLWPSRKAGLIQETKVTTPKSSCLIIRMGTEAKQIKLYEDKPSFPQIYVQLLFSINVFFNPCLRYILNLKAETVISTQL